MKKVLFIAAIAVAGFTAQAQTTFGIQAGANLATIKTEPGQGTSSSTTKANTGLTVGVLADVPFTSSISFRPELNYIQKGGEEEYTTTVGSSSYKSNPKLKLGYIQMSPNFVYNIPAGGGNLFLGLGPEFSVGISGKQTGNVVTTTTSGSTTTTTTTSLSRDVEFDGDPNTSSTAAANELHLKSFDYGANFLGGYKMSNGIFFSAGYTLGLSNISPDANYSHKNSGFNIKLGYMFGGSGKTTTN